ncbi:hypothetical protein IIO_02370 [Bacillus cereus VD115]|nr:hypothetical protein IIO_02370 [Bacillus cereus VD115]
MTYSHGIDDNDGAIFKEFEPGERRVYKWMGGIMMTQLINNLYKKPFTQLFKERVFEPLNFKETAWRTIEIDELVKVIIDPSRDAILPIIQQVGWKGISLFLQESLHIGDIFI